MREPCLSIAPAPTSTNVVSVIQIERSIESKLTDNILDLQDVQERSQRVVVFRLKPLPRRRSVGLKEKTTVRPRHLDVDLGEQRYADVRSDGLPEEGDQQGRLGALGDVLQSLEDGRASLDVDPGGGVGEEERERLELERRLLLLLLELGVGRRGVEEEGVEGGEVRGIHDDLGARAENPIEVGERVGCVEVLNEFCYRRMTSVVCSRTNDERDSREVAEP